MGKHPKYCKLIFASNGNMQGNGQTRYWDGQPRADNDILLQTKYTQCGTICKKKINVAGVDILLKGDPNGNDDLGHLYFGTWSIKVKLKLFGIKIITGYVSKCAKYWEGDMLPITNSAGGLLDFNSEIQDNLIKTSPYTGNNGVWQDNGTTKWGKDSYFKTDGFHWSFVPTSSAFNYGVILNNPFDFLNMNIVFSTLPAHMIYGFPGATMTWQPSTTQLNFPRNPYIRNNFHTDVRNDFLWDNNPAIPVQKIYPICPSGPLPIRGIRMLNREIGDNEISLENRLLHWEANLSLPDVIRVNKHNEYYKYPSIAANNNTLPSVHSKEEPYWIDNTGKNNFFTNNHQLFYYPPISGAFTDNKYTFVPCCNNYLKQQYDAQPIADTKDEEKITIYPNPATREFTMQFIPTSTGKLQYKIVDMYGRVVYKGDAHVTEKNSMYYLPVQLSFDLPLGQYFLLTTFNEQLFSNKIIIK